MFLSGTHVLLRAGDGSPSFSSSHQRSHSSNNSTSSSSFAEGELLYQNQSQLSASSHQQLQQLTTSSSHHQLQQLTTSSSASSPVSGGARSFSASQTSRE